MSDPIDRTELLKKAMPKNPDAEFHYVSVKDIMAMPSAEPEVVRCKECMHYDLFPNGANGTCEKHIDARAVFYPWDFCSHGERRTDEQS